MSHSEASPELVVTNLKKNFTGVSATASMVVSRQRRNLNLIVAGHSLGSEPAVSLVEAFRRSRRPPEGRRFVIWHVRRNNELLAAAFGRDVLRLPIRIVFTSAAQRLHSAVPRWLISRADAAIATTPSAAGFVNAAAIVPHGVDVERFTPAPDPEGAWARTGLPGKYGIATIGRIRPEKGTDLFVEAMTTLLPSRPEATALIVGACKPRDAMFKERLIGMARSAGVLDRVVFLGELPAERMPGLLQGVHLLVAAPRYEGFGMTPLEAMACGVPVVATRTGAFVDIVQEGVTGSVVPIGDAASLSAAIEPILDDPALRASMGARARERVVQNFSIDREVAGIQHVYDRIWAGEALTCQGG
jgi:mannosyltransferase